MIRSLITSLFVVGYSLVSSLAADPVRPAVDDPRRSAIAEPLLLPVDPLYTPQLTVDLGPEQKVASGAGWPYLFQAKEGTTVAFGHVRWLPKVAEPIVFMTRSFDGRKTWEEWKPAEGKPFPITEGAAVQLKDGRILLLDVHAHHKGNQVFEGKAWFSSDGWKTISGPEPIKITVPGAQTQGIYDDRGEPVSRLYIRRSIVEMPNGNLLATAYGRFGEDDRIGNKVEYQPKMKQHRSYLIRSTDGGKTWAYFSTIAAPPLAQEGPGEPVMIRLAHGKHAGRLICQMRLGREHAVWQAQSDDDGKTWTKGHPLSWVYSRFGRTRELVGVDPDLIEMSDGTLAMSYGHKVDFMDNGNFLAFSLDQGETWICETRVNTSVTVAYTGVREVSPGTLFVVYTETPETKGANYRNAVDGGLFTTMGRTVVVKKNTTSSTGKPGM